MEEEGLCSGSHRSCGRDQIAAWMLLSWDPCRKKSYALASSPHSMQRKVHLTAVVWTVGVYRLEWVGVWMLAHWRTGWEWLDWFGGTVFSAGGKGWKCA